jgi:hypothetical protein
MTSLICDRCRAPLPAGARFCPRCADPVTAADRPATAAVRGSERVQLVCPRCRAQAVHDVSASGVSALTCPACRTPFSSYVVQIRSKRSSGSKRNGTRSFTVRVQNLAGRDDLIEFVNASYDDFELKSKDLAAFTSLNGQLTIVQNLTVGRYLHISRSSCYVATCLFGPGSDEVRALRAWRDGVLLPSRHLAALVSLYYAVSPGLVRRFGSSPAFRRCATVLVRPFVARARRFSATARRGG